MIYLDDKYIEQIKQILSLFSDKIERIYAFGSRVRGNYKKYSDLDLAIKFKKSNEDTILYIRNALEESSLPIRVDLVDLDDISESFKSSIIDTLVEF
ncbi:MAG: nucleotidyltransferase domain-containing protein [Cyanobacteria bacterium SIG32]|nr:nucleotidyltransferase domain-containing protein [Cyanobacteria bacterium SIG32]